MLRMLNMFTVNPQFNPIALRKAKIVYNFGLSECNKVKSHESSKMSRMLNMFTVNPQFNPIALRKAKIVYNFGLSECNKVSPTNQVKCQEC